MAKTSSRSNWWVRRDNTARRRPVKPGTNRAPRIKRECRKTEAGRTLHPAEHRGNRWPRACVILGISNPRLVIAGTNSGVGKTNGCLNCLRRLSPTRAPRLCVQRGSDYLHPTCQTLDGWMMGRESVLSTFSQRRVVGYKTTHSSVSNRVFQNIGSFGMTDFLCT